MFGVLAVRENGRIVNDVTSRIDVAGRNDVKLQEYCAIRKYLVKDEWKVL